MNSRLTLLAWMLRAAFAAQRGRFVVASFAVAIGVALATAVHTVNRSALSEFQQAIQTVNGEASLQVVATAGSFDERLYDELAASAQELGIAALSPVLAIDVTLPARRRPDRPPERLTVLGLDVFRAGQATPALLPQVAKEAQAGGASPLLADDTIFLSAAAQAAWGAHPGDTLRVEAGMRQADLRVVGSVAAPPGQRLAVMDIGAAQWRLGLVGRLTRIDLKLAEGARTEDVRERLARALPASAAVERIDERAQRMSNLSRAYRVNLNVLALVALFTGAFLVFSAVALSALRQRPQLALLAVLGADGAWVRRLVLAQGLAMSSAGSIAGLAGGLALAKGLLLFLGGDLGGGYFSGAAPPLAIDVPALAALAALGVAVGVLASWLPAREALAARPTEALRSGSAEHVVTRVAPLRGAIALMLLGIALLFVPAIDGLPLAAYAAIACLLLAKIAAVPWVVRIAFGVLAAWRTSRGQRDAVAWLALARIAQAPGQSAGVIAGVVASFALTVAMVIMVSSFRLAVADWLDLVLPAELYGRVPAAGGAGAIPLPVQERIRATPGVARAEFTRAREVSLDPARPPVLLLARVFDANDPARRLALTGAVLAAPPGRTAVFVSEATVDLYGAAPGTLLHMPVVPVPLFVAGVYRDYARQHGSVTLERGDYVRLTGDDSVNDIALWLAPRASTSAVIAAMIAAEPGLVHAEFRSARELRDLSLRIFDRSFAMTYVLEAAALIVALFGVASSYAGQALSRAREFGVLRHLGLTTRDLVRQVAIEGACLSVLGAAWGAATGWLIGEILIRRVNPQSFHWTMETHIPWGLILVCALALALAGAVAAALAVRRATGDGPLRALKEDW